MIAQILTVDAKEITVVRMRPLGNLSEFGLPEPPVTDYKGYDDPEREDH